VFVRKDRRKKLARSFHAEKKTKPSPGTKREDLSIKKRKGESGLRPGSSASREGGKKGRLVARVGDRREEEKKKKERP